MAAKTRDGYVRAVAQLAVYYHRSPDRISDREVQTYLLHLMRERKLSWSSCNVAVHGLRFFYHQTLGREKTTFHIPGPRKPSTLPEILSQEEVARLFTNTYLARHRVLLMTAYAAGLRVSEGAQDRYTLLSPRLLAELRRYWQLERPSPWLFPTRRGKAPRPMHYGAAERIYVAAKHRRQGALDRSATRRGHRAHPGQLMNPAMHERNPFSTPSRLPDLGPPASGSRSNPSHHPALVSSHLPLGSIVFWRGPSLRKITPDRRHEAPLLR